jgi:hypothetical protein
LAIGRLLDDKIAEVNRQRDALAQLERELNDAIQAVEQLVVRDFQLTNGVRYDQAARAFIVQVPSAGGTAP